MNLEKPKVTICCVTYNHEKFIEQCLKGFLNQKTEFVFEILVHDDASTDANQSIIKSYEEKFPNKIKGFYQTENQFDKQNTLVNILIANANGDYIALCEGDDFWIDQTKLQQQVDFLEANPDYAACYHGCKFVNEKNEIVKVSKSKNYSSFSNEELLCSEGAMITNAVLFRNKLRFPDFMDEVTNGDAFFWHLIGFHGHGKFLADIEYSAYRVHSEGMWTSSTELQRLENFLTTKLLILRNLTDHFPNNTTYTERLKETVYKEFSNYFYRQLYHRNLKEYFRGYKLLFKFSQFSTRRVIAKHIADLIKRLFNRK